MCSLESFLQSQWVRQNDTDFLLLILSITAVSVLKSVAFSPESQQPGKEIWLIDAQ